MRHGNLRLGANLRIRPPKSMKGFYAFPRDGGNPILWSANGLAWTPASFGLRDNKRPLSQPIFPKPGWIVFIDGSYCYYSKDWGNTWGYASITSPVVERQLKLVYNSKFDQFLYSAGRDSGAALSPEIQFSNDLTSWSNCGGVNWNTVDVFDNGYTCRYVTSPGTNSTRAVQSCYGRVTSTSSFSNITNAPFGTTSANNRVNTLLYRDDVKNWLAMRYDSTTPNKSYMAGESPNGSWVTQQIGVISGSKRVIGGGGILNGTPRFWIKERDAAQNFVWSTDGSGWGSAPLPELCTTYWGAYGQADDELNRLMFAAGTDLANQSSIYVLRNHWSDFTKVDLPYPINSIAYCPFEAMG